jgi:hypothetical protein
MFASKHAGRPPDGHADRPAVKVGLQAGQLSVFAGKHLPLGTCLQANTREGRQMVMLIGPLSK